MIDNNYILGLIEECLKDTDRFLVYFHISKDNKMVIVIDSDTGVTISHCVELSRHIEGNLDRDKEDFELKVSSAGIDNPFLKIRQYKKNIGKSVKVLTKEEKTIKGILISASENEIEIKEEIQVKNKKNKKTEYGNIITIPMKDIKETKGVITF